MRNALTVRSANVLYLVTVLLVITIGSVIQLADLSWGLIGTELFLLALPTVLFLRFRKVPLRQGLRFTPIKPLSVLLCLLMGASIWLVGGYLDLLLAEITGIPPIDIPPEMLPDTMSEGVLLVIALALAAPIGEELLFRGAIQGAYETRFRSASAITIVALMFAIYHFRLAGTLALLPVAFMVGYVVWRTQSIWAGMAVHFANNLASGLFTYAALFTPDMELPFPSLLWAAIGAAVAAVSLYFFVRENAAPVELIPPVTEEAVQARSSWLATYWPVLVVFVLYLAIGALTLVASTLTLPA
jgi:membrane protease YdiL (CAAX protease family)